VPRRPEKPAPVPTVADSLLALQRSAGNAAVARRLAGARMLQRTPTTIVQHGEMSGDQFQIAAALLSDRELHLYLVGSEEPSPRDKGASIYDFYVRLTGIPDTRVHFEKLPAGEDPSQRVKDILRGQTDPRWQHQTFSVGAATNTLRDAFRADKKTTKKVREAWLASSGVEDEELDAIVRRRNIPLESPIAVLWSRQSGAAGGLHPDLDSSYTGIEQLAERYTEEGYTVMIVGDDPGRKITGQPVRAGYEKAKRLGQFWETDLRGKPRTAQFAFFEHLRQLAPTLTHVGMRSGNLEAYAYMGHRVLFIEERDRSDAARMEKLVGIDTTLKYRSVKIEELPTRTGRALMGAPAPKLKDDATYDKTVETGPRYGPGEAVDALLRELKAQAKTVSAHKTKPTSKTRAAYDALTTVERARVDEWVAHAQLPTPSHQQGLKEYRFVKEHFPQLLAALGDKGFKADDLDKVVDATQTVFWQVSVPEDQLPSFTAANVTDTKLAVLTGLDEHDYLLSDIREERERVASREVAPHVRRTKVYDFVRLPDNWKATLSS
jgi:hypothetical protein